MGVIPIRLCCGQRHQGSQCPDGKVMCQLCYDRFEVSELDLDPSDGKYWDVCKLCAEHDRGRKKRAL